MKRLLAQLKRHEGFRGYPYSDTTGHLTIGYGRNLDAFPIDETEAAFLLVRDLERHSVEMDVAFPVAKTLDDVRRAALLNMAFNMGVPRLRTFRKMWAAINEQDWILASIEALDSKWAKQVGYRAKEIAQMIQSGRWDAP